MEDRTVDPAVLVVVVDCGRCRCLPALRRHPRAAVVQRVVVPRQSSS